VRCAGARAWGRARSRFRCWVGLEWVVGLEDFEAETYVSRMTLTLPEATKNLVMSTQWPGMVGCHSFLMGVHSKMMVTIVATSEARVTAPKANRRIRNLGVGNIRR